MTENISVHSGKHFEYLLEPTVFDGEMADRKSNMEDRPNADPCRFDVLKVGEGEDVDIESHHDVDMNTNIRFINQEQHMIDREEEKLKENVDNFVWDGRGDDNYRLEEELQRHYQKLEEDYSNLERANLVDSLDCTNEHAQYSNVKLQDVFSSKVDTGSKIDEVAVESNFAAAFIDNEIETKENCKNYKYTSKLANNAEKDLNPKPGFRYKEPVPKFITKNRIKVGMKSQGSYYQKFLMEKKATRKNEVSAVKGHDTHDYSDKKNITGTSKYEGLHGEYQPNTQQHSNDETIVHGGMNLDNKFVNQMDTICRDPQKQGASSETGGYLSELKYLRESVEISRLEDLIKEEELNLTNNVLDMSASESKDIYDVSTQMPNKSASTILLHEHQHQNRGIGFDYNLSNTQINQSSKITSEPPRKDDHPKNSSYEERHYLNIDKQNLMSNDTTASYAAQHLDRKKEASYKKYSLKDYKALNKDVKLQRSLGPDKSSDVYLEKKAKADKLKDYASAVATYNRQRMVVKKAKSAPAPTIRDRLLESKRAAALEYSKKVKSSQLPRKSLKDIEKRRCSEQSGQLSALEIMKQRHESERLAVEEMRQNLANILKEVKS